MELEHIDEPCSPTSTIQIGEIEHLAPEVLFRVLIQVQDLESLDNLLQASPAASRLFDLRGAEIFDTILSSDPNTHEYTRALIRITALLRATALPLHVHDLTSFKDMVRNDTTTYRYRPSRWEHSPLPIPGHTSTSALRDVLVTNRKIQHLAFDCLQFYLDTFRSLKPLHPVDKDYRYESINEDHGRYEGPWRLDPVTFPVDVQDIGTPSWIEQQRVLRALWRIWLFHDLKVEAAYSCITWPEKDLVEIRRMGLGDLYDVPLTFRDDEWTARLLDYSDFDRGPDTLLEAELIQSVVDYLAEGRELMPDSTYLKLKTEWASSAVTPSSEECDWDDINTPHDSPMWLFFCNMSGCSSIHEAEPLSPLQHVSFAPFRRLGFPIWCRERLSGYGLLAHADDGWDPRLALCSTAWRSVLTEDERAAADEENQRRDDEMVNAATASSELYQSQQGQMTKWLTSEDDEDVMGPPMFGLENDYLFRQKDLILRIRDEEDNEEGLEQSKDEEQSMQT